MERSPNPAVADRYVLTALKNSKTRLYTTADLATDTFLDPLTVDESLHRLVPAKVRVSEVRNTRGAFLFAPVERTASARELRVNHPRKFIRVLARFWYFDIGRLRTCDL